MKHWERDRYGITLIDDTLGGVLQIKVRVDNRIEFREQCDMYYFKTLSPSDAIEALEEAIAWIRSNDDEQQKR